MILQVPDSLTMVSITFSKASNWAFAAILLAINLSSGQSWVVLRPRHHSLLSASIATERRQSLSMIASSSISSFSGQRRSHSLAPSFMASTLEGEAEVEGSSAASPPTRRPPPPFPKPNGPFVLLEGLPYAATDDDIRSFFQGYTVQSVNVPRAPENSPRGGQTKGLGVVELGSAEEAVKAMELSGNEIMGRWVTVEQCVDPAETKTIKIRGVPFTAKAEELADYFGQFGTVDRVTVSHDRNGIAYVTFKENASAVAALAQDGCELDNRWLDITLYLKAFRPQPQGGERKRPREDGEEGGSSPPPRQPQKNRIRLSGIPFESTADEIQAAVEDLGLPISNIFVPAFRANPERNTGLAYMNLADETSYRKALEIAQLTIGGRTVYINEAVDRMSRPPPTYQQGGEFRPPRREGGGGGGGNRDQPWQNRVYLGNLPFDITAEDLVQYFARSGVTGLSKVALPKTKVGTAYLAFDTPEMAQKATELDGQPIEKDGRARYLRANLMDDK